MSTPEWLSIDVEAGKAWLDPDVFYPEMLDRLGVKPADADQYWLEVAYCFARWDAELYCRMAGIDGVLEMRIKGSPEGKRLWGQKNRPAGKRAELQKRLTTTEAVDKAIRKEAYEMYRKVPSRMNVPAKKTLLGRLFGNRS